MFAMMFRSTVFGAELTKMNWRGFSIWKCCLFFNVLIIHLSESKRLCRDFKKDSGNNRLDIKIKDTYSDKCPLSASDFRVYRVLSGNNSASSDLLLCWSPEVRHFVLQFGEVTVREPVGVKPSIVHSCSRRNDTVVVQHRLIRDLGVAKLLLKTLADSRSSFSLRVKVVTKRQNIHRRKLLRFSYLPNVSETRRKRSVIKDVTVTQLSECGETKSCFRYGWYGCGHLACEYFLSYRVESNTLLELEMSGNTTGWIAVGFSSDKSMGGDEVIACYKKGLLSEEIEAATYNNPYVHNKPEKHSRDEIVTLLQSEAKDGFIYCRLSRPVGSEGYLDLTNDWHQFYATGPVSQAGEIEKHTRTPHVSRKVSVLQMMNLHTLTFGGRRNGASAFLVTCSLGGHVLTLLALTLLNLFDT